MGGLFGRRRGGNVTIVNDNSALIRQHTQVMKKITKDSWP